jgi:hypothetical protein
MAVMVVMNMSDDDDDGGKQHSIARAVSDIHTKRSALSTFMHAVYQCEHQCV